MVTTSLLGEHVTWQHKTADAFETRGGTVVGVTFSTGMLEQFILLVVADGTRQLTQVAAWRATV